MFVKNLKVNIQTWVALILISLIFIGVMIEVPSAQFVILIVLAVIWLAILPFCLFIPPFGLLYFVKVDATGIKILFCKKVLREYVWEDVKSIDVKTYLRNGLHIILTTNDNKHEYIAFTKKLQTEILKYFPNIVGKL